MQVYGSRPVYAELLEIGLLNGTCQCFTIHATLWRRMTPIQCRCV